MDPKVFETIDIVDPITGEKLRHCLTCNRNLSVSDFYLDGKNSKGEPKYRRDCKDCYRRTRLSERAAKRPQKVNSIYRHNKVSQKGKR